MGKSNLLYSSIIDYRYDESSCTLIVYFVNVSSRKGLTSKVEFSYVDKNTYELFLKSDNKNQFIVSFIEPRCSRH